MASVSPYLNFNGNCEEAFDFYKSVFGKEFTMISRFKDMPSGQPVSEAESEKIMHVSLLLDQDTYLMGSDVPEAFGKVTMGTNFNISINVGSEKEANNLFNALSAGGNVTMPLEKTFWGAYFGMLADKFGIQWMVNYDYDQQN